MGNKLKQVAFFLQNEEAQMAQGFFDEIAPEETPEYLMIKGKLDQKFQRWGDALNAYLKVLELDEENTEAQNNLHFIQNIINFWNPEMFNP